MSWLFSQALVEEYSEASSLGGTPSVPSNTTPTPQAFLSRDKTTDAWNRFPSGMTCEPLTENRGEALLKSFLAASHAPTSVPPAKALESPASSQDCGAKWRALSVKFDRASSSWKTVHCLLSEDLPWSSVTLPKWGMMRDGELWERTTSALPTSEKGFGLWRSPTARDWKNARNPAKCDANGGYRQTSLTEQLCDKNGKTVAERNGQVTPEFCEWLMGFPSEWTASEPLATPKFQQWLHSHGVCSAAPKHTTQHND
jgi:hypothetical protein